MRQTRSHFRGAPVHPPVVRAQGAYALLEEARLRCEHLQTEACHDPRRYDLEAIHRQLGMAGWAASAELDPPRRHAALAYAHRQSVRPKRHPVALHALAETVIEAEDNVAECIDDSGQEEHLHLAHVYLLHAMDLLYAYL